MDEWRFADIVVKLQATFQLEEDGDVSFVRENSLLV